MIDLHTHSTASDGTFTPTQLVQYAKSKNISTIALTDHDTTAGLEEAKEEAQKQGIVFVPGIELSVSWPTGEFHLLGLGLKENGERLNKICKYLKQERENRNRKIAQKLKEAGVPISFEEVQERFQSNNVGRPHFAQVLQEKGIVKTRQVAFDKYFAQGRPCYVKRTCADLEECVLAIKESGGIPVQAHPMSMYVSWGKMNETIRGIQSKGVMGLEAWHPGVRISEAQRLEKMAKELGMITTGGSDFHGEKVRADRKIGHTTGGYKIEDRFWSEELEPALGMK